MNDDENSKVIYLTGENSTPRVYKKRWFMLLIYLIIFPISTMQWTQFTLIANIVAEYYNVSYEAVNWTLLVTVVNSIIFVFPNCYVVDKYGIKTGAILAMGGATIAAWIKVYSVPSNKFWLVILGQAVLSIPQMSLIGLGPKLSADWFGPDEVAIANSIGIIGLQLGNALGFLLPPMLVKKETVEEDLHSTALGLAIICTVALVLVFLFLNDKPPVPPSRASSKKYQKIQYIKSIKKLMKNISYLLVLIVVGSNIAILCLIQSLLNQIILKYYPAGEKDAGLMGLLMMVFCIIGCFLCGGILMKFKTYRLCFWISTLFMAASLIMFTNTLNENIIFPYVAICVYGFFYGLFWNISYEVSMEFTYPEPEAITIGLVYTVSQILTVVFIYFYSFLFYQISDKWANHFLVIITIISFILTLCTKYNLKRTAADLIDSECSHKKI